MEELNIEKEILKIQEDLELSGRGMAKLMEVSYAVYKNKKSDKSVGHSFNVENYLRLVKNLVSYNEKLKVRFKAQGFDL